MITMKKKIISGSLVALMALGLAGCANNSAAPSSKVNHPQTTKLAQSSSKKSTNSSSAKAVNENSVVSASLQANSSSQVASVNTKASYGHRFEPCILHIFLLLLSLIIGVFVF